MSETAEDRTAGEPIARTGPCLIAALHCEQPTLGGAGWSLDDVDEIEIGRGSERRGVRRVGPTRVLAISIPGRLLSRKHARITRTPHGWLLIDESSRNGTYVGGRRIDKHMLGEGDIIDCGRTLFRLGVEAHRSEARSDCTGEGSILGSVTPRVLDLERDLERIATSDVPVLLFGESGTGKTHVAHAIHRLSGRGHLVRFDVDAPVAQPAVAVTPERSATPTTLLVENLDRATGPALTHLERELEAAPDARVIATSLIGHAALAARLPPALQTRLTGFVCEIPPLRDRIGDIGVLAARLLGEAGPAEIEIEAGRALLRHPWPGNVRELAHRLKIATSLSAGEPLRLGHLLPESV